MKTIALVQARMQSTRLPGKMMAPLGDKCVLNRVLDRVARAQNLSGTVVATSDLPADNPLAEACRSWGFPVFRGSESDVLGRFVGAARAFDANQVIRVNADNPLIDPAYIDQLVEDARPGQADYTSFRREGRPVMLTALSFFAERVSRECLERAEREITDPTEREHVTIGIYKRPERYAVRWIDVPSFCADARLRFTIDTAADLELVRQVWASLGNRAALAGAEEIVRLALGRPDWMEQMAAMNAAHPKVKKEGLGS